MEPVTLPISLDPAGSEAEIVTAPVFTAVTLSARLASVASVASRSARALMAPALVLIATEVESRAAPLGNGKKAMLVGIVDAYPTYAVPAVLMVWDCVKTGKAISIRNGRIHFGMRGNTRSFFVFRVPSTPIKVWRFPIRNSFFICLTRLAI